MHHTELNFKAVNYTLVKFRELLHNSGLQLKGSILGQCFKVVAVTVPTVLTATVLTVPAVLTSLTVTVLPTPLTQWQC